MLNNLFDVFVSKWNQLDMAITKWWWNNRTLALPEIITAKACKQLRLQLEQLARESDEPILLKCDSYGGRLYASLKLANCVRACRVPVVTLVYSRSCSAAVNVFAAGHVRLMRPNAVIGTHACEFVNEKFRIQDLCDANLWLALKVEVYRQLHTDQAQAYLERLIGGNLPDNWFGNKLSLHDAATCKRYKIANGIFFKPPVEAWWRVKKLRHQRPTLATA